MLPNVAKVQQALHDLGIAAEVVTFSESTRSAQDAADTIGCSVAQIVKSLIFRGKTSQRPILVLASGVNRVDEKKIAALVGEPIERADADFVRSATGYAIGGVPPLAHAQALTAFIDEDLLQYAELWAAAGSPNSVFKLSPDDLSRLSDGRMAVVK